MLANKMAIAQLQGQEGHLAGQLPSAQPFLAPSSRAPGRADCFFPGDVLDILVYFGNPDRFLLT